MDVNTLDEFCQSVSYKKQYEENVPKDFTCCLNCRFFEKRTHFCRKNPPTPIVFSVNFNKENAISSKFPVITHPTLDWCGSFITIWPKQ